MGGEGCEDLSQEDWEDWETRRWRFHRGQNSQETEEEEDEGPRAEAAGEAEGAGEAEAAERGGGRGRGGRGPGADGPSSVSFDSICARPASRSGQPCIPAPSSRRIRDALVETARARRPGAPSRTAWPASRARYPTSFLRQDRRKDAIRASGRDASSRCGMSSSRRTWRAFDKPCGGRGMSSTQSSRPSLLRNKGGSERGWSASRRPSAP